MKGKLVISAALMLLSATIHADADPTDSIKPQIVAQLKVANAEADAKDAIAHGNHKLLAVYGYTLVVPGIHGDTSALRAKYGLRILEGTSDAFKNSSDREFNENARKYASIYNRIIIESSK